MRDLIHLIESHQLIYYHGSKNPLTVGTILRGRNNGYVSGYGLDEFEKEIHSRTEHILEKNRPNHCLSRTEAVFMVTNPSEIEYAGGYDDYVYVVEPLGPITECNLYWYGKLYLHCEDDAIDAFIADNLASNYWNATSNGSGDLYEFLVSSARIISIVKGTD